MEKNFHYGNPSNFLNNHQIISTTTNPYAVQNTFTHFLLDTDYQVKREGPAQTQSSNYGNGNHQQQQQPIHHLQQQHLLIIQQPQHSQQQNHKQLQNQNSQNQRQQVQQNNQKINQKQQHQFNSSIQQSNHVRQIQVRKQYPRSSEYYSRGLRGGKTSVKNRERARQIRANETLEQREKRLRDLRERARISRLNESDEQRRKRLSDLSARARLRRLTETEDQRKSRLEDIRQRFKSRRESDTDVAVKKPYSRMVSLAERAQSLKEELGFITPDSFNRGFMLENEWKRQNESLEEKAQRLQARAIERMNKGN